jgi:hypothetical protein
VYVNPTQVYVNPTQVYVNPTQVYVNPTQVCVNPTQVAPRMRTVPSWFPQNRHLHGPGLQLYRLLTIMVLSVTCIVSFCFIFFLIPTSFTTHLPALPADDFTWARQTFGGLQNLVKPTMAK